MVVFFYRKVSSLRLWPTVLIRILAIIAILCPSFLVVGANGKTVVVDRGKSDFQIVLADTAHIAVKNAAHQLAYYLNRISGSLIPVRGLSEIDSGTIIKKSIFIGFNERLTCSSIFNEPTLPSTETIIFKSLENESFILSGGSPRATLYAVFEFLETHLKCRWWAPNIEEIPTSNRIEIPELSFIYTPPFQYRSHFVHNTTSDSKFATAMKENGYGQQIFGEWGGRIEIAGWAHTFSSLMPVDKYFMTNPEWFADPSNGNKPATKESMKPRNDNTQLCLGNESLFGEFLKNTLSWIGNVKEKSPSTNIFSISINDNQRYCVCENSGMKDRPSDVLILFLNRLVKEVNLRYPGVKLQTLAYFAYHNPPIYARPDSNLLIMVAPVEADYGKGIQDKSNELTKRVLVDWAKISNAPFYWGYNTNFNHLLLPHPTLSHIKEDLNFLMENNYKGVFLQDNNYTSGAGYFLDMQAWVVGKLLWNPLLDQEKLIEEFFDSYYGDAGKYLRKYFELINTSYLSKDIRLGAFNEDFSFLTPQVIERGERYFRQAYNVVAERPELRKRVEKEEISFRLMKMTIINPGSSVSRSEIRNPQEQVDSFFELVNKMGIKRLDFKVDRDVFKRRLEDIVDRNQKLSMLISEGHIAIQESNFYLFRKGEITDLIEDESASNGFAATMAKSGEWAIQNHLASYSLILSEEKWRVKVYLRAVLEKSKIGIKDAGDVEVGIYDNRNKKIKLRKTFNLIGLSGDEYISVDLPLIELKPSDYIWLSIKDWTHVKRLLVDKIELINH